MITIRIVVKGNEIISFKAHIDAEINLNPHSELTILGIEYIVTSVDRFLDALVCNVMPKSEYYVKNNIWVGFGNE